MILKGFNPLLNSIKMKKHTFINQIYEGEGVLTNCSLKKLNLQSRTLYTYKWNYLRLNIFKFIQKKPDHFTLIFKQGTLFNNFFSYNSFKRREYHDLKYEKKDQNNLLSEKDVQKTALNRKMMFLELSRVIKLLKGEVKMLSVAFVLLVSGSSISMSMPYIVGKILDYTIQPSTNTFFGIESPHFYIGLVSIFFIGASCNFGRILLLRIISERVISRLRSRLYQSAITQDIEFFNVNSSGDLISRLSSDTAVVAKSLTQNVSDGLKSLISTTVGLTMMAWISVKLTFTMMLIIPPIVIGSIFYGRYVKVLSKKIQKTLGDLTKISENLRNIYTIKAFTGEIIELRQYHNKIRDIFHLAKSEALLNSTFLGLIGFSGNIIVLVILAYGGYMVNKSIITIGDLSSFLLYTAYTGSSMMGLSGFYSEFMKGLGASYRLFELMDKKSTIKSIVGMPVNSIKGTIRFEDVCFAYPSRPDTPIFSKLSFTVEQGTNVTICGPSGGGKSTIASLLLRFYDIDSGKITINNVDIREFNLKQFRKKISIVPQNPALFPGTIKENLVYGRQNATLEEILKAIEKSNSNFIMDLPNGINTYIGNDKLQLSGGQKQRIAIARALIKNPEILILDEATSALDGKSEVLIDQALQNLIQQKNLTTITIAHRLSTIQRADKIIVLDQTGRLIEEGTYIELSKNIDSAFMRSMKFQMCGHNSIKNEHKY